MIIFISGKGTTDALFTKAPNNEEEEEAVPCFYYIDYYIIYIYLEKAFDRVPKKVVRRALRKLGVTLVRTAAEPSERFEIKVGLHHGSV